MSQVFRIKISIVKGLIAALALSSCAHHVEFPHILAGCRIYSSLGEVVRQLEGGRCLPLSNGSYLSASNHDLALIDANGLAIWRKPMHTHHIVTVTSNGDFLIGSSEIHFISGEPVRYDVLYRFNRAGDLVGEFSFFKNRAELLKKLDSNEEKSLRPFNWDPDAKLPASKEFSHLNSYYEIPELTVRAEGLRPGSLILNSLHPREFILVVSPDLKKIEFFRDLTKAQDPRFIVHDVQVLPNAHVLMYNNLFHYTPVRSSSLDEVDASHEWSLVWRYTAEPESVFYSNVAGGVQLLPNGHLFFSDISRDETHLREIERSGREVWSLPLFQPGEKPTGLQDAKRVDLKSFLQNNRTP